MCLIDSQLVRNLCQADLHSRIASRTERTSLRHVEKVDRCTRDRNQFLLHIARARNRTKQTLGIFMARIIENVFSRTSLADTSAVHNYDLIGHLRDNTQVMRNDNDGHVQFFLKVQHQLQNLCLNRNVQSGRRLICDQDRRLHNESHSNHNTLAHTAGELMRILLHTALRIIDTDHLEHLDGIGLSLFLGLIRMDTDCFRNLISYRVDRIQRCHRILEDHRTVLSAEFLHLLLAIVRDVLTLEQDLAFCDMTVGIQDLHNGICGNGFTGT